MQKIALKINREAKLQSTILEIKTLKIDKWHSVKYKANPILKYLDKSIRDIKILDIQKVKIIKHYFHIKSRGNSI